MHWVSATYKVTLCFSPPNSKVSLTTQILLAITMVIFALLISLAKLYANKFNYNISPNHELIALGSANLVGSFFLCFPSSASLSRSSVQERTGAKTQMVGIISSVSFFVFRTGSRTGPRAGSRAGLGRGKLIGLFLLGDRLGHFALSGSAFLLFAEGKCWTCNLKKF